MDLTELEVGKLSVVKNQLNVFSNGHQPESAGCGLNSDRERQLELENAPLHVRPFQVLTNLPVVGRWEQQITRLAGWSEQPKIFRFF